MNHDYNTGATFNYVRPFDNLTIILVSGKLKLYTPEPILRTQDNKSTRQLSTTAYGTRYVTRHFKTNMTMAGTALFPPDRGREKETKDAPTGSASNGLPRRTGNRDNHHEDRKYEDTKASRKADSQQKQKQKEKEDNKNEPEDEWRRLSSAQKSAMFLEEVLTTCNPHFMHGTYTGYHEPTVEDFDESAEDVFSKLISEILIKYVGKEVNTPSYKYDSCNPTELETAISADMIHDAWGWWDEVFHPIILEGYLMEAELRQIRKRQQKFQKRVRYWFLPRPPWKEVDHGNLYRNGFDGQIPKTIQQVTAFAQKTAPAQPGQHQHSIKQHMAGPIIPTQVFHAKRYKEEAANQERRREKEAQE